jgi:hypothetical protein
VIGGIQELAAAWSVLGANHARRELPGGGTWAGNLILARGNARGLTLDYEIVRSKLKEICGWPRFFDLPFLNGGAASASCEGETVACHAEAFGVGGLDVRSRILSELILWK